MKQLGDKIKELATYKEENEDVSNAKDKIMRNLKAEAELLMKRTNLAEKKVKDFETISNERGLVDAETQTDQVYQPLAKVDSKASSKGSRVGGGGTIAKPPRNPS